MRARFSNSFKSKAVEKALNRNDNTSLKEVAKGIKGDATI